MKSLKNFLVQEGLSRKECAELEDLVKKLSNYDVEKFKKLVFRDNPDNEDEYEYEPKFKRILSRYDDYVEDAMWTAFHCKNGDGYYDATSRIQEMAENNQYENGTEPQMIIYAFEEICDYLKI